MTSNQPNPTFRKVERHDVGPALSPWRQRVHRIIHAADTPAGLAFDVVLLVAILVSVAVVMAASVASLQARFGVWLLGLEWLLTGLFTVEYGLRLLSVRRPLAYATSFFGVVDLLSLLPT